MLAPLVLSFAFLTWRESVVGMKPSEMVQMDIRRTWDIAPQSSVGGNVGMILGGGVESETLGYVRWRMRDEILFSRPVHVLRSEGYDKKAAVLSVEEVWTDADGNLVRQRDEKTTLAGKQTGDATFYKDHIELTRTDAHGKSSFAEVNPAGGMEEVQRRFHPMEGDRKEFLRLDAVAGSFKKVVIEKKGRFRGTWGGDAYEGPAYRFSVDGQEQTAMLTSEDEIVQVALSKNAALVLAGPTKSRRKGD
jgi:hypothetical protein